MNTEETNHKAAKEVAQSLNGVAEAQEWKLITKTIQDVNPVSFSLQCEQTMKQINPETLVFYGVHNVLMNVRNQQALVFIATVQHWGDEKEHAEWIAEIKRASLLIKP